MISLRHISWCDVCHTHKQGVIMEGYVAILMPVLLMFVIFIFVQKMNKDKYNAIIQISKNIEDQSKIKDLLEDLEEKKKPIDYRRSGVITFLLVLVCFSLEQFHL
jgi:hypothetical protein